MSRGKRYNDEQKLNIKKVLMVILVVIVILLFIKGISNLLKKEDAQANNFSEISYFTMYNNGKWGVINSNGDTVIEASDDEISNEMIIVPNNKKDVFICTYNVNYSDATYKTKAINASKEELFTAYSNVEAISNYNQDNSIWYETNCLKVQKDEKYGLIDFNGNEILSCVYDKIDTIKGVENSIIIQKDNLYGLVNASGNVIVEPAYEQISALTDDYNNGYIVKNSEGLFGIIGSDKTQILECKYTDIKHVYGNGMYVVNDGNTWKIVKNDEDDGIVLTNSDVKSINNDNFVVVVDEKYGVVDSEQKEKISAEYQYLEYIFADNYIAKKDDKYGVVNLSNETVLDFEYTSLVHDKDADSIVGTKSDDDNKYLIDRALNVKVTCKNYTVKNGFIRANVDNDYKFYNLKFEEKSNRDVYTNNTLYVAKNDGKYGLVNRDGKLVVSYQYEDITEQNEYGFVAVKKDGKWGVIDQYGNTVVDYKYDISDISKVSVIGRWHLAENVNAMYYISE